MLQRSLVEDKKQFMQTLKAKEKETVEDEKVKVEEPQLLPRRTKDSPNNLKLADK